MKSKIYFLAQKILIKYFIWILIIVFGQIFMACDSSKEELRQVENFHKKYIQEKSSKWDKNNEQLNIYLDFSPSVLQLLGKEKKYLTPANLKTFLPSKIKLFRFGDYPPVLFRDRIKTEVLDNITKELDTLSLVKDVVQKIVTEKQNSLLITDFEYIKDFVKRYRAITQTGDTTFTHINPYPWATPLFKEWFEGGNILKVISFPNYNTIQNRPKNLYGLLFLTPNSEDNWTKLLENNRKLINKKFVLYHFGNLNNLKIEPKNFNRFTGVIVPDLATTQFFRNPSEKLDFYTFRYGDFKKNLPPEAQGIFLRNLFPELDTVIYKDVEFDTKITDFTEMFVYYKNFAEHEPVKYGIDSKTGDSTIVKAPSISFRFTGGMPVNDAFQVVYDSATNEISLKFHSSFEWDEEAENERLYLVQIRLKNAQFSPSPILKKYLQVIHPKGFRNESLYRSLLLAMPENPPADNPILYQCYLRIE